MRDADGRVGYVHMLSAAPRGADRGYSAFAGEDQEGREGGPSTVSDVSVSCPRLKGLVLESSDSEPIIAYDNPRSISREQLAQPQELTESLVRRLARRLEDSSGHAD